MNKLIRDPERLVYFYFYTASKDLLNKQQQDARMKQDSGLAMDFYL